jgi:ferrochelatase
MPAYVGPTDLKHGQPERLGVLLVNLGTPDSPEPADVRRFLAAFLSDPRVIELPRWLWLPILHGVILRIRPSRSAHAYRQIWTERGSPLLVHSQELATRLQASLSRHLDSTAVLALGMSYGNPSIPAALDQLRTAGATRLVVLPLYPQYSGTTTASVFDRVTRALQGWRWVPELRFVMHYHDEPAYIEAVAAGIEQHWQASSARSHLLLSFHGIPKSYVLAGDPYYAQCARSARLIAERLALRDDDWSMSFQSQVGRAEWLRPYTDELLIRYASEGRHRNITIACPGFSIDCLETLEEIAIRNRETFMANGGTGYSYVPALNATDSHVALLTDLILRHTQGWPAAEAGEPSESEASTRRFGASG